MKPQPDPMDSGKSISPSAPVSWRKDPSPASCATLVNHSPALPSGPAGGSACGGVAQPATRPSDSITYNVLKRIIEMSLAVRILECSVMPQSFQPGQVGPGVGVVGLVAQDLL